MSAKRKNSQSSGCLKNDWASIIAQGIPYNIKWDVMKRAAPYNPITKIWRLCIAEKFHIHKIRIFFPNVGIWALTSPLKNFNQICKTKTQNLYSLHFTFLILISFLYLYVSLLCQLCLKRWRELVEILWFKTD